MMCPYLFVNKSLLYSPPTPTVPPPKVTEWTDWDPMWDRQCWLRYCIAWRWASCVTRGGTPSWVSAKEKLVGLSDVRLDENVTTMLLIKSVTIPQTAWLLYWKKNLVPLPVGTLRQLKRNFKFKFKITVGLLSYCSTHTPRVCRTRLYSVETVVYDSRESK